MYVDNEIYFDVAGSGAFHHEGYVFIGGPGRAVFDRETLAFLRLEPLGGVQPLSTEESVTPPEPEPIQQTPLPVQYTNGG